MKNILVLFLLVMISCKIPYTYREFTSNRTTHAQGSLPFYIADNSLMIAIEIDSVLTPAKLDLGFSGQIVSSGKIMDTNNVFFRELILPEGNQKMKLYKYLPNIQSEVINIAGAIGFSIKARDTNYSCITLAPKIILGAKAILPNVKKTQLYYFAISFTDSILSYDTLPPENLEAYTKIKWKYKQGVPVLELSINGHTDDFIFDTGNGGFVVIGKNTLIKEMPTAKPHIELQGTKYASVGGKFYSESKYYDSCQFDEFLHLKLKHIFNRDDYFSGNLLSFDFISKYDWVFDLKSGFVYAKPVKETHPPSEVNNLMKFYIVKAGSLVQFCLKESNNDQIKLFTPIKRINDYILDANTSCETLKEINALEPEQFVRIEYAE